MKKTGIIVLIVLQCLIAVALCNILILATTNRGGNFVIWGDVEKIPENIVKEKTIDLAGKEDLDLDFVSSEVYIKIVEGTELKVIQYSNKKPEEKELFQIENTESKVKISEPRNFGFHLFYYFNSTYEVHIPKEYVGNLNISSVSGDVEIAQEMTLKKVDINLTSADIRVSKKIKAEELKVKTISGEISWNEIICPKVTMETTSGDIQVEKIGDMLASNIPEIEMKSISGEIKVGEIKGKTEMKTTSGNILLQDFNIWGDSTFKSTSGNIKMHMNAESNAHLKGKSTSGRVTYPDDENTIGKEPYHKINAETTSGNIRFE